LIENDLRSGIAAVAAFVCHRHNLGHDDMLYELLDHET
jgi:hypothetical protein